MKVGYLVRSGHFPSRLQYVGHTIRSAISENPMLHANFTALPDLLQIEVLRCRTRDAAPSGVTRVGVTRGGPPLPLPPPSIVTPQVCLFAPVTLTLTGWPSYIGTWPVSPQDVPADQTWTFYVKTLSKVVVLQTDRQTDRQTERHAYKLIPQTSTLLIYHAASWSGNNKLIIRQTTDPDMIHEHVVCISDSEIWSLHTPNSLGTPHSPWLQADSVIVTKMDLSSLHLQRDCALLVTERDFTLFAPVTLTLKPWPDDLDELDRKNLKM